MILDFSNFDINTLKAETDFEKEVLIFLEEWFSDSKTVKVQTSGSTGIPKILEVEKQKMRNSAQMTLQFLGLAKKSTALLCLPVAYISGKMMLVRAMENQMKIIVAEPKTKALQSLQNTIDFCALTPLQVENSLDKIKWIKNIIIGGAAVSENLKKKIQENTKDGNRIFETYGMSETLSHIALKQICPIPEDYFTILEGVEISLDERKCLEIFAPKLHPQKLLTNDIVEIKNTQQFKFLGRADHIINSGGVKINPEVLETILKKEIELELIFAGIPDEILGEKLVLILEGNHSAKILEILKKIQFPSKIHTPKEIFFVDNFPRTDNGKILRHEIVKKIEK